MICGNSEPPKTSILRNRLGKALLKLRRPGIWWPNSSRAVDGPSWTKRVTWSFIKIMKLLGRSAHILNAAVTPRCWRDRLSSQIRVPAPRRAARFSIKLRTSSMRLGEWPRLKLRTAVAVNLSILLLDQRGSQGNGLMEIAQLAGPFILGRRGSGRGTPLLKA